MGKFDENISANIKHYNIGRIIIQDVDSAKVSALIDELLP